MNSLAQKPSKDDIKLRGKMIKRYKSADDGRTDKPKLVQVCCTINDGDFEDIVIYMGIIKHIEEEDK